MVKHFSEDYGNSRVYWVTVNDKVIEFSLEEKGGSLYMELLEETDLESWEVVAFQDELKRCIIEYKQHLLKHLWN